MRKKLGLALGSGGAKGIVHIGALQALKEENILFDVVSGTSIGSIVGAMYSLGYTAREMISVFEEMGIGKISFFTSMKFKGESLSSRLKNIIGDRSFSDLKLPFRAVATNLKTGEEEVLSSGDLCLALSASCAIPPAFPPVIIEDKMLVDGAFVNAIPASVCYKMGAKYILGIDLGSHNPTNYKTLKVLNTFYKNNIKKCNRNFLGYKYSNIILAPDLTNYNLASIKSSLKLFDTGYEIVKNNLSKIKEKLNIASS